jgi:hypothetical protein
MKSRFRIALTGQAPVPLVAGLTFAPAEVLAAVTPGCPDIGECLLEAARALALDFVFVPATAPWAEAVAAGRGDLGLVWVVDGPVWPVLSGTGDVSAAIASTAKPPPSLVADLDRETWRAISVLRRGLELQADAIAIADDLAGRDGMLFTPAFTSEHVLPRLSAIAKAAGKVPVLLHSDGDTGPLLPQLPRAGFVGVHTGGGVDRDRFEELFWEARRMGLFVVGGVATASLSRGSHAAVRAGTRAALLAQTGGLLVADDGGITTAEEMNAYATAVGAARGGGVKPVGAR